MIQLRRESSLTLTDQIVEHFTQEVAQGRLPEGSRLPSVRQLAGKLGVSAHTAMVAYERLVSLGCIRARRGAGYYVAPTQGRDRPWEIELEAPAPDTPHGFVYRLLDAERGLLQVSSGFLPPAWLNEAIPASALMRAARLSNKYAAAAPPNGCARLRHLISCHMQRRDVPVSPAHIVTTIGATHALHLVAKALAGPGDVVLVDDPGYFFLQSQLADLGIRVVGVPRGEHGPDLEFLDRVAEEYHPRAFFTQSALHNPTGWNMPISAIHRLLMLAQQRDFVIVEDDVYAELAGDQVPRIAQLGGLQRVVYIGGYSKVLSPALRVGFVAARLPLAELLVTLKLSNVLSGSLLEEELLAELMESGRLARHALRLRERIARTRAPALAALLALGIRSSAGSGSSPFLWCELPHGRDGAEMAMRARIEGILLAPGDMFSRSGTWNHHVRLNIAHAMHPRLLRFFAENLP